MDLPTRYGRWALVTGSAHGLGKAFAQSLAARGLNLVLVDVDAPANERTADELGERFGVETRAELLDVGSEGLADWADQLIEELEVGVLVNNAGRSTIGAFLETDLDDHLQVLRTNGRGTLVLTHRIGRAMAARGRGAIVIVSSASALTGTAEVAHYAATKAYGLGLATGLWAELEGSGVDLLALCPGLVHTRGTELHPPDLAAAPFVRMMDAADVAEAAVAALESGRGPLVVPGWDNRLSAIALARLAPRRLALRLLRRMMLRLYPRKTVPG